MEILTNYHEDKLSKEYKDLLDNVTYWAGGGTFFGWLASNTVATHLPDVISSFTPYVVFLTSLGTLGLLIYNFSIKIIDRRSLKNRSKEIHEIVHGKKQ